MAGARKTRAKAAAPRADRAVLFVVSECAPLVKTGGLADVAGSLPSALSEHGCRTRVLLPAYRGLLDLLENGTEVMAIDDLFGGGARVLSGVANGLDCLLLDAPHLYDRDGGPYTGPDRNDWTDNDVRFGALARVGALIGQRGLSDGWRPDIVHGHDWQAGLMPFYLAAGDDRPATVFSIHNIAYQGIFGRETVARLGLPRDRFDPNGFEYYGNLSMLKAGLVGSDMLSTVSETYASELSEPAFGLGMEGIIQKRGRDIQGIVNGIDTALWDPATDPEVSGFTAARLKARRVNRDALIGETGLTISDGPIHSVVSRLTPQKGLDLVLAALPALIESEASLVLLGSGDTALEEGFRDAAKANPGRIAVTIGYDERMAHRIYAGADTVLVPSRFEPCGLTQLYGLRYGALPVVARTGGLADTVIDANTAARRCGVATGFQMVPGSASVMAETFGAVARAFLDRAEWTRMQRNAMKQPVGWDVSARQYRELYDRALLRRA
ncbi:MAG: glycogen synthase GlgA [Pseudomonadota bacterium]